MAKVNKTKSDILAHKLKKEIDDNTTITTVCNYLVSDGDNIEFDFASELSGAEDTELDSILVSHTSIPESFEGSQGLNYVITGSAGLGLKITGTIYSDIASFIYKGTDATGSVFKIKILAHMTNSNKTGQLRIMRSSDGLIIGESSTFNNTDLEIVHITSISNLPPTEEILVLQGKVTSGGNMYVKGFEVGFQFD